jgi:hypothetical protein
MASLLVEELVVDEVCAPLLTILVPGSIAVAALFSLDLDPLEHFYPSNKSDALIYAESKMVVINWLICVTFPGAVHQEIVILPFHIKWRGVDTVIACAGQDVINSGLLSLI